MTPSTTMPPARRRPIPGMSANPTHTSEPPTSDGPPGARADDEPTTAGGAELGPAQAEAALAQVGEHTTDGAEPSETLGGPPAPGGKPGSRARPRRDDAQHAAGPKTRGSDDVVRWPAADYTATRLVNFRLPVDLHDRFKQLVRDVEVQHPKLRHPSLTELLIALLEEGPTTADEVAVLIRRKRAAEHQDQE